MIPDLQTAQKIWQDGIDFRFRREGVWLPHKEYVFHTTGVAKAAQKIAENTLYLNPEKAYILGLLHDYGKKYDERAIGSFHGKIGYEELLAMGYDESARICLTHSFPDKNFRNEDYIRYPADCLAWARQKLQEIEYDDYDRLIQLCDMFFEGMSMVSFERRFAGIQKRYGLQPEQLKVLRTGAMRNKAYFDKLCRTDVYKLLGIEA